MSSMHSARLVGSCPIKTPFQVVDGDETTVDLPVYASSVMEIVPTFSEVSDLDLSQVRFRDNKERSRLQVVAGGNMEVRVRALSASPPRGSTACGWTPR
jgi:hypothetical protein